MASWEGAHRAKGVPGGSLAQWRAAAICEGVPVPVAATASGLPRPVSLSDTRLTNTRGFIVTASP